MSTNMLVSSGNLKTVHIGRSESKLRCSGMEELGTSTAC